MKSRPNHPVPFIDQESSFHLANPEVLDLVRQQRESLARAQMNASAVEAAIRRDLQGSLANAPIKYFSGLDLGQANDYTALVVMEERLVDGNPPAPEPLPPKPLPPVKMYTVLGIKRFKLGTNYEDVVDSIIETFSKPPLKGSRLGVDFTGVGRPVVNFLCNRNPACSITPITITGGRKASCTAGVWSVPKADLVSTLQLMLQNRRLQFAKGLRDADVLEKELRGFQVKITEAANETFGAWREGDNDDVVLAAATAGWLAVRGSKQLVIGG